MSSHSWYRDLTMYNYFWFAAMLVVIVVYGADQWDKIKRARKITHAAIDVTVYMSWNGAPNTNMWQPDSGAPITFIYDNKTIMKSLSTSYRVRSEKAGQVTAQAFTDTNVRGSNRTGTIPELKDTQEIRIEFPQLSGIPDGAKVTDGYIAGTINTIDRTRDFDLHIPQQTISNRTIIVKLTNGLLLKEQ